MKVAYSQTLPEGLNSVVFQCRKRGKNIRIIRDFIHCGQRYAKFTFESEAEANMFYKGAHAVKHRFPGEFSKVAVHIRRPSKKVYFVNEMVGEEE